MVCPQWRHGCTDPDKGGGGCLHTSITLTLTCSCLWNKHPLNRSGARVRLLLLGCNQVFNGLQTSPPTAKFHVSPRHDSVIKNDVWSFTRRSRLVSKVFNIHVKTTPLHWLRELIHHHSHTRLLRPEIPHCLFNVVFYSLKTLHFKKLDYFKALWSQLCAEFPPIWLYEYIYIYIYIY